jgi:hypothetical protein
VAAPASAQSSFGAGFVHTDQNPLGPGFNLNAYVTLPAARSVRVGVDFTYFRSAVDTLTLFGESFDFRLRLWELSTNLHYRFVRLGATSVYGLGGLGISRFTGATVGTGDAEVSPVPFTRLGGNLGGGIEIPLGFGAVYGEARHIVVPDHRNRYTVGTGIRIRF